MARAAAVGSQWHCPTTLPLLRYAADGAPSPPPTLAAPEGWPAAERAAAMAAAARAPPPAACFGPAVFCGSQP